MSALLPWAVALVVALPLLGVLALLALRAPRAWTPVAAACAALETAVCLGWAASGEARAGVALALGVNAALALVVLASQPRRGLVKRDVAMPLVWLASGALVMLADDARLIALGWVTPPLAVALTLRGLSAREADARRLVVRWLVLGSLPLLVAIALVVAAGKAEHASTPWLVSSWRAAWLSPGLAGTVFLLVAGSVLVRLGVPPMHGWLPRLSEALPAGTMLSLTAVQMAVHVMVRLALAPLPEALPSERLVVLVVGAAGVVVGSLLAAAQHRLRRAVAFVAVAQSSALVMGLAVGELVGVSGALANAISVAITSRGMMLVAGAVEARVGPVDLRQLTGLSHSAPRLAAVAVMMALATVALPGSLGFVGEDLLLQSLVHDWPALAAVLVLSSAVTGIVLLRAVLKTCFGPAPAWGAAVPDLFPREKALLGLGLAVLVLGLWPDPLVRAHRADAEALLKAAPPAHRR